MARANAPSFLVAPLLESTAASSHLQLQLKTKLALAQELQLAKSMQWQKLLYYVPTWFQGRRSMIDSQGFFLSQKGKSDAAAELEETLFAFAKPIDYMNQNLHAQCLYPARMLYLNEKLRLSEISEFPKPDCRALHDVLERVMPQTVSLVFSDFYLNNPVSLFGHVFLRFSKPGQASNLLDLSLGFAADTSNANLILTMLTGPFGGPDGRFFIMPYYAKVQEYNNFEGRDLWEYDLNYSPEQVKLMAYSIWEISQQVINYYYLDDNCALALLAVLDVGRPELHLSGSLRTVATPTDAVKVIAATDKLVKGKSYRASSTSRFKNRYAALNAAERERFEDLIVERTEEVLRRAATLETPAQRLVLDASIEFLDNDLKLAAANVPEKESDRDFRTALLLQRAALGDASQPVAVPKVSPDEGHDTKRIGVSAIVPRSFILSKQEPQSTTDLAPAETTRKTRQSVGLGFNFRGALHDWSSPLSGYPAGVAIEFVNLDAVYWPPTNSTAAVASSTPDTPQAKQQHPWGELVIDKFTLFSVKSGQSYSRVLANMAWNVELATRRDACATDLVQEADRCRLSYAQFGGGLAYELVPNSFVYFYPAQAKVGWHNFQGCTLELDPNVGTHLNLWPASRIHLNAGLSRRFTQEQGDFGRFKAFGLATVSQLLSRNTEIRVSANFTSEGPSRASLESYLYF